MTTVVENEFSINGEAQDEITDPVHQEIAQLVLDFGTDLHEEVRELLGEEANFDIEIRVDQVKPKETDPITELLSSLGFTDEQIDEVYEQVEGLIAAESAPYDEPDQADLFSDPYFGGEEMREALKSQSEPAIGQGVGNFQPMQDPYRFTTKDSGERAEFASGMVRDTETGKARYDLLFPEAVPYADQFLTRCAELMARGAEKYNARNWELAAGEEEMDRFKSSAVRHLVQWLNGETDEDHAAAVYFNLMAAETLRWKLDNE